MRTTATALMMGLVASGCVVASAFEADNFKLIHVADLEKLLAGTPPAHVYDANGAKTRQKEGVIPGAVLLTSAGDYDIAKVLPVEKDAPLVFYCHNRM